MQPNIKNCCNQRNWRSLLVRCFRWLIWHLKSERRQLEIELQLKGQAVVPPKEVPTPTILSQTRCELERLRNTEFPSYLPGLSDEAKDLVGRCLRGLIEERNYTTAFPMSNLHGCTASKAGSWPERSSCHTMAQMGSLINDLRDLEGKSGGDRISACLNWPELRLDDGILLITDTWHKRFYWRNSGGSHHMAVLCYELQRQGKEWCPEVQVREYVLHDEVLESLEGTASLFVVMRDLKAFGLDQVFKPLQYRQGFSDLRDRLGVEVLDMEAAYGTLCQYCLVAIDHSKKHAYLGMKRMAEAVRSGYALPLKDFLRGWCIQTHGFDAYWDSAPGVRPI